MLLRLAAGTMTGLAVVTVATATLALGAGAIGTALLARRLCEERRGWREGAEAVAPEATAELPPV